MAVIEVDHSDLRSAASTIDMFSRTMSMDMGGASINVNAMIGSDFIGTDAVAFQKQWEDIDGGTSAYTTFRKNLVQMSDALSTAAKLSEEAQARAYNTAAWLPKFFY